MNNKSRDSSGIASFYLRSLIQSNSDWYNRNVVVCINYCSFLVSDRVINYYPLYKELIINY